MDAGGGLPNNTADNENGNGNGNGGRVSTKEFYQALLEQNKSMVDMERRIMSAIGNITQITPALVERINAVEDRSKENHGDIEDLQRENKIYPAIAGVATLAINFVLERLMRM